MQKAEQDLLNLVNSFLAENNFPSVEFNDRLEIDSMRKFSLMFFLEENGYVFKKTGDSYVFSNFINVFESAKTIYENIEREK